MTVRGAAFLGVGAMVGAGIFALLGEAGAIAGSAVWLSFLLGGVVAGLLGYVVAKLGARYPSSGGILTFLLEGFGPGHVTGVSSWLLYFSAIIVTSMVAVSFGAYGSSLFFGDDAAPVWGHVLTSAVIVGVAAINIVGSSLVDRLQSIIVVILLAVFAVFIVATLTSLDATLLDPETYPPALDIVSSIALTFFAYLGFAIISFTGGDLPNPKRDLPRAMYLALGITTVLYVLVAIGVFGALTPEEVIANGETALAVAAKPSLGDAGFALMAVAALLATSSSVNANIYGAANSTSALAASGQFPPVFGQKARVGGTRGLVISTAVVLLLANLVDLSAIASLGSIAALAIFLLVALAGFRLRDEAACKVWVIVAAIVATVVVLTVFAIDTFSDDPGVFVAMVAMVVLAIVLEFAWSRMRTARSQQQDRSSPVASD
jgi:amino acid transporter